MLRQLALRCEFSIEEILRSSGFDPDLVGHLLRATRDLGIEVLLNAPVTGIEKSGGHLLVRASVKNVGQSFETDLVVHRGGRAAEIDDLDLGEAGISHNRKGIEVNQYLQSVSNSAVYAAGDAAVSSGLPLTPVAGLKGEVVASNLLKGPIASPTTAAFLPSYLRLHL